MILEQAPDLSNFERVVQLVDASSVDQLRSQVSLINDSSKDQKLWKITLSILLTQKQLDTNSITDKEISDVVNYCNSGITDLSSNFSRADTPGFYKLLKFLINDLNSDFNYFCDTHNLNYKIIELVSKKINLLTSTEYNFPLAFKIPVVYKIIDYLIISNYDFRKIELIKFIMNYIEENKLDVNISKLTSELLTMLLDAKFITSDKFNDYLKQANTKYIRFLDILRLLDYLIQNNIYVASKSYKSVRLSKLNQLLNLNIDHLIIGKMIVNNSLPPNTKFDQVDSILCFPDTRDDNYNDCLNMVQNICNKLVV